MARSGLSERESSLPPVLADTGESEAPRHDHALELDRSPAGSTMIERDPFAALRPRRPTPASDLCACADDHPLVLRSVLTANPLGCLRCNLEVPIRRLGIPPDLAAPIAAWRSFHDCFYLLWLDSGEFEAWARAQLLSPASAVNTRGLALARDIRKHRPCYYGWFSDSELQDLPSESCVLCDGPTRPLPLGYVCDHCWVLFPGEVRVTCE